MTYANEIDQFAAEWIGNLFPPVIIDTRSIKDVTPADLIRFGRCHFFAGIGGWEHALDLAGWPADRPVWTGSCPCQPYSAAGKQKGDADERNLWPDFFRLIRECRPDTIFGEQVANAIGHGWLDRVQRDLEGEDYAVGHCVLGAHSVGSPHIRQRLFWVADNQGERPARVEPERTGVFGERSRIGSGGSDGGLGESIVAGLEGHAGDEFDGNQSGRIDANANGPIAAPSAWLDSIAIQCGDGKSRRISAQPGDEPLAYGFPRDLGPFVAWLERMGHDAKSARAMVRAASRNRTGRLRGYGNAIVPQVAAVFIKAFLTQGTVT